MRELIKEKNIFGFNIKVEVVDFCVGCSWFSELYTESEHIAGTTIQVPAHLQERHHPKHYIGQYEPRELARDYAKQGRTNPSQEAYSNLQKELAHYMQASDCSISVTVCKAGLELGKSFGCRFDYSCELETDLVETALIFIKDYGLNELVKETCTQAREKLQELAK